MYQIELVINFLKDRELPESWSEQLDWDKVSFVVVCMDVMDWLSSSMWLPKGKPFKSHRLNSVKRISQFIEACCPELFQVMEFQKGSFDFKENVDKAQVYEWVKSNYTRPTPRAHILKRPKNNLTNKATRNCEQWP